MRFEFEKVDTAFVIRRVRAAALKADRRVTKVILTKEEWREFMLSQLPPTCCPEGVAFPCTRYLLHIDDYEVDIIHE
jgi:hypothetical protein